MMKPTEPAVLLPPEPDAVIVQPPVSNPLAKSALRRCGFSLVELLVAMAIIVILVSMLLFAAAAVWRFVHKVLDMAQG